jgi:hypothetical protein
MNTEGQSQNVITKEANENLLGDREHAAEVDSEGAVNLRGVIWQRQNENTVTKFTHWTGMLPSSSPYTIIYRRK